MFPERTSEVVVPFCDGCVNVWLWCCVLTHFWLAAFSFVDLALIVCLFVCFYLRICSHPQARPGKAERCEGDSGGLPSQRGGVLQQGDSDPHHEWAEREWVLTIKTCLPFGHHILLANILLLSFNTNSCFLQLCRSSFHFHTFAIKTANVL